ncbi:MAG: exodeoxyribonuclease VII large subunit [Thermodesulfovibrio sp.]|nr:exodeoxyribonuclease VII large subunit [Thermodesulfovibrio sp.]
MFNVEVTYQTLSQYLNEVREIIQEHTDLRWIVAEVAKVDIDKNGHYRFELVEKKDNEIIAQADAVVWRSNIGTVYDFINNTGMNLQKGIKILFLGKAIFHEKHGFKLNILQIDPSYTVGDMALKKKEVIERLTKEGLIDKNKSIEIPLVIQRIAVVSSEYAAGYEDFLKILRENSYGFKFYIKLFDAFVQGESAVSSLVQAFQDCKAEANLFDVVVLIRGGGSVADLACFNEYELAKTIALMPIPIFTGIGHTRDETVADFVSSKSFKTPSEVAKFIIERAVEFDTKIENLKKSIIHRTETLLKIELSKNEGLINRFQIAGKNLKERLAKNFELLIKTLHNSTLKKVHSQREKIFSIKHELLRQTNLCIKSEEIKMTNIENKLKNKMEEHINKTNFKLSSFKDKIVAKISNILTIKNLQIEGYGEKLNLLHPENILKRGYSITYVNGRVLKNSKDVKVGSKVQIQLYRGKILGNVIKKEEEHGELKLF